MKQDLYRIKCRGVVISHGELLVVEHRLDAGFHALPGGHLENGELPEQCMERELFEELGIKAKIGRLLYVSSFTASNGQPYFEFIFEITNGDDFRDYAGHARSHAHELSDIRWVKPSDELRILPVQLHEDFKKGEILSDKVRFIRE